MDEEEQETFRVVEISKPPVRDEEDPTLEVQDMVEPQETIETLMKQSQQGKYQLGLVI